MCVVMNKASLTISAWFFLLLINNLKLTNSLNDIIVFKSRSLYQTLVMPEALLLPGIPLQFLYLCSYRVTGCFRRPDGRPLNVLNMRGPYDRDVVWEPYNAEDDPLSRTMGSSPDARLSGVANGADDSASNEQDDTYHRRPEARPQGAPSTCGTCCAPHHVHDMLLIDRALRCNILAAEEVVDRRSWLRIPFQATTPGIPFSPILITTFFHPSKLDWRAERLGEEKSRDSSRSVDGFL